MDQHPSDNSPTWERSSRGVALLEKASLREDMHYMVAMEGGGCDPNKRVFLKRLEPCGCEVHCTFSAGAGYRGTSPVRKRALTGPYSRTSLGPHGGPMGGVLSLMSEELH